MPKIQIIGAVIFPQAAIYFVAKCPLDLLFLGNEFAVTMTD
jgi:hypothetical protein